MKDLNSGLEDELALIKYSAEDIKNQCFIDTATWGLDLWENQFGIITDSSKTYDERREIVKAKRCGAGTTTVKMIKNMAEAFSGGEVNVIEHPQDYSFTIKFTGVKGIPKNMESFEKMIENIKPAHLSYDFNYTYTVWSFLKQGNLKWDSKKTWNDLRIY